MKRTIHAIKYIKKAWFILKIPIYLVQMILLVFYGGKLFITWEMQRQNIFFLGGGEILTVLLGCFEVPPPKTSMQPLNIGSSDMAAWYMTGCGNAPVIEILCQTLVSKSSINNPVKLNRVNEIDSINTLQKRKKAKECQEFFVINLDSWILLPLKKCFYSFIYLLYSSPPITTWWIVHGFLLQPQPLSHLPIMWKNVLIERKPKKKRKKRLR